MENVSPGSVFCKSESLNFALPLPIDTYLPAAVADAGVGIVDAAELAGGDALDGLRGVDVVALFVERQRAWHEVVHVAHLELYGLVYRWLLPRVGRDEMEVGKAEVVAVLQLRVPAVGYEDDVLLDVLLDHEPWAAAQAEPLALPDGVEPVAAMCADDLARLDVNDLSFLFAHEAAHKVVVVDLS